MTETRRAVLRGTYARGWLCFECHQEKRRLSPIPEDWTICADEKLESYMRVGERVGKPGSATLDFSAEPPLAEAG